MFVRIFIWFAFLLIVEFWLCDLVLASVYHSSLYIEELSNSRSFGVINQNSWKPLNIQTLKPF